MIALTFAKVYRRKAKKLHTEKRALYQELLQGVELLKSLTEYDRLILADALQPSHYSPGDRILRFGDDPEWMHIILEGEVEVVFLFASCVPSACPRSAPFLPMCT